MKKYIYPTLLILISAIIFAVIGLTQFVRFSGNSCVTPDPDPTCECFCCHMFGLRGYESCGNLGLIVGGITGAVIGFIIYKLIKK